jgi:trichothecene 3-O-acetyltransferase
VASKKFPTYAHLKKSHFPLSELPTAQLSPLGIMPQGTQPVMAAQANFIEGGLLLTVGAHHSVSDGIGFSNILDVWAKNTSAASASTSFTKVDPASNDRSHLMTGLPGATLSDCPEYVLAPTPPTTAGDVNTHQMAATPTTLPPMTARIFYFSPSSLCSLKIAASAHSTNDALYAALWRHITLARNPLQNTHVNTTHSAASPQTTALLYAVNIRPRLSPPLPPTYLGNASMASVTERLPISTLTSPLSLAAAAATIRASINAFNTPNRVLLTLGLLASRPDTTDYKFAYNGFLGPDLSATTWADFGVYEMEWGSLGKPECFRIPGEGMDGSIVVLPRVDGGGLEVVVGLEDGAMGRLMKDQEFLEFAEVWA